MRVYRVVFFLTQRHRLVHGGYDPGVIDGLTDDQTRAAISEFQSDHALVATGIGDPETGELLGIVISQSSQISDNVK